MNFILNNNQQRVVDEAVNWYFNSPEQVFQYVGLAGTGKSVVLNEIIRRLGIPLERIAPMAYIGQAAIVMRLKGLYNAKTIHSQLFNPVEGYKLDEFGNIMMDKYLNKPMVELKFEPKDLDNIDLIVIDEAGSVPYELKYEIESRGKKIIATGDLGQLPPVTGNPAYLYNGKVHELTEIMRQSDNSGILHIAHRARQGLPIHTGYYGDCMVITESELNDYMISKSDIIICGKNATRDTFNKRVRHNILGINTDIPGHNERLICRKNNWNIESGGINLANGLIGRVTNFPGVDGFDGKTYKVDFQPILAKESHFKDVYCDYNYLIAPHHMKDQLKKSKYSIGEKFEFAYAITSHLSQGGEFRNGIYYEEYLRKDIQNNLNYTGITRFKQGMIYVKKDKKYY
ncbi:MAG: ATP-dependent DNA helicase [Paraclostridium sp.]